VAELLDDAILARVRNAELSVLPVVGALQASPREAQAARAAAWRAEPCALALSQRALALLLARFNAGTLFAPLTPVELATAAKFHYTITATRTRMTPTR
jgi:hypothetical protein